MRLRQPSWPSRAAPASAGRHQKATHDVFIFVPAPTGLCRVVWAVLRVVTTHWQDSAGDDAALAALNLLALGLHHLAGPAARPAAGLAATATSAAAGSGAEGGRPLPAHLVALLDRGEGGFAPGLLSMVREIATGEPAGGGRRREYGWELAGCAAHLAGVIEAVLQREQAAQQAPAAPLAPQAPAPAAPPPALAAEGSGGAGAAAAAAGDDEAAQRKERARLKREKMLAQMKVGDACAGPLGA